MIINHPGRLHEGVDYSRPHELEPKFLEVLADPVRERGGGRDVLHRRWAVDDRLAADIIPDESVEAAVFRGDLEKEPDVDRR